MRPWQLPKSGGLLRELLNALDLQGLAESNQLRSRTARRFLAGEKVKDEERWPLAAALGSALHGAQLVETARVPVEDAGALPGIATHALWDLCETWDEVASQVRMAMPPSHRWPDLWFAMGRLMVIDLAVRLAALWLLLDLPAPPESSLDVSSHPGLLLRKLASRAGRTRASIADSLGISAKSVDDWFDGAARPRAGNIVDLADLLSEALSEPPEQLATRLRRHYFTAALFQRLRFYLSDSAEELATKLSLYARQLFGQLQPMKPLDPVGLAFLVTEGWHNEYGRDFCGLLYNRETDALCANVT